MGEELLALAAVWAGWPPATRLKLVIRHITIVRNGSSDALGPCVVGRDQCGEEIILPLSCENITWTRNVSDEGADALRAAVMLRL